ncbi:MAG TPA: transcriptional regulator [Chromatiales bacterium]|nr:transcriptional regulator [Chromatiales bacterium]
MNRPKHTKKQSTQDWHPADIKAALEKAGWSLSRLSIHHGYASRTTLKYALRKPWPKGERLIAEAIGMDPATIWPSRYPKDSAGRASASLEKTA